MTAFGWVGAAVAGWFLLSIPVALAVGRMFRRSDELAERVFRGNNRP